MGGGHLQSQQEAAHQRLYPHNTYHGPTPHHRAPLAGADFSGQPIRFTTEQQHQGYDNKAVSGASDEDDVDDEEVSLDLIKL